MEYTDMIDSSTPMSGEGGNGSVWTGPYLNNSWEGVNATNGTFINKFYFYESVQFAVMWILLVAIVVGNSTVILALLLSKARKSRMNYFIMQLAIADLWVGLFSVLTDIVQRITIVWVAGNLACKCIRFLQGIVTYSSTYVLVALSIDRCDAITHPMNFTGSWSRARGLIVTAWTLSIIFSIPMLILYEEKHIQGQLQCWIDLGTPSRWQLWMTSVFISLFVLPAVTIAACYTIIVLTIRTKSQAVMPPNKKKKASRQYSDDVDSRRASSRGIIPKAKIKTVKMTFVIVFVFIICWLPYMVFDLLQVYECIPNTQTSMAVATLIQSLAPLNSAANPVIYCIFSSRVFISLRTLPPYKWLCWWRSSATKSHAAHTELITSSHRNRMRTFRASANTRAADCASRQQSERHARTTSTRQVRLVLPEEPP